MSWKVIFKKEEKCGYCGEPIGDNVHNKHISAFKDVKSPICSKCNYGKEMPRRLEAMQDMEKKESVDDAIDDLEDVAEEYDLDEHDWSSVDDASDYLLKFFEGSQREGATVGSSAAEVAKFATSKDSKTERANWLSKLEELEEKKGIKHVSP